MKKITSNFLKEHMRVDSVSKRNGVFTVRKGFFYTHGGNAVKFKNRVVAELEKLNLNFEVVDFGENWAPFRGGAPLPQSSHWFVKFEVF